MLVDLAPSLPAGWFTATLSNPGQPCGFIWICNWCGEESTTPATKYAGIEADYRGHTCAGEPYDEPDFIVTWAAKGGPTRIYV